MQQEGKYSSPANSKKFFIAFFCLAFLILFIYSNTFHASWQFDDKPNIVNNVYLHLKELNQQSLFNTLITNPAAPWKPGNKLFRPIPSLTFGLNWYFGGDNVIGYHIVNLVIHILNALLLFLTILNLFQSPNLKNKFGANVYLIALLATALWAIHPIQTQAVTYIVQRMTSMATLFYILSMFFYVKCRLSSSSLHRILLLFGCGLAFLFALGSKENTATLPGALLLIEVICFQNLTSQRTRRMFIWGSTAGGILLIVLSFWLFIPDNSVSFITNYNHRPFSLTERLLTEPRIVFFYLSLIFYPIPNRFSIEHDVTLSTSLFQPWITLPAILLTLVIIGIGFSQIRRRPLLALAILFFYLNHIIESTIIPLELVFEHRNYLPSLFLFLPVAAGFSKLLTYSQKRNKALSAVLAGFFALLIIAIGSGTYIRNRAWATEISLWKDAMIKAPKNARPLTNLAWQMAYVPDANENQYDEALKLYEKALLLQKSRTRFNPIIMGNMAGIYFRKGEYQKAIELLEKALAVSPDYAKGRYDLIQILITRGRWNSASEHADYLLTKHADHEGYLNQKGLILLHQKRYDEAIEHFQKSLSIVPQFKTTLMGLGVALSLNGNYGKAEIVLRRAHQTPPKSMTALFGLIENSLRAGDTPRAMDYTDKLISTYNITAIKHQLKNLSNDHFVPPLSPELISQVIASRLAEKPKEFSEIPNQICCFK